MLVFFTFQCVQNIMYFKINIAIANKKYISSTCGQGSMLSIMEKTENFQSLR